MDWYSKISNKENVRPTIGININDSEAPWTDMILDGIKTIETRNSDSLRPYVGKRVGIIQTGKGKAKLVGFVTVGEPKKYESEQHFSEDQGKHRVTIDSSFWINGVKFGYPMINPERVTPIEVDSRGIISRKI